MKCNSKKCKWYDKLSGCHNNCKWIYKPKKDGTCSDFLTPAYHNKKYLINSKSYKDCYYFKKEKLNKIKEILK